MEVQIDPRDIDTIDLRHKRYSLEFAIKELLDTFEKDNPGIVISGTNVNRIRHIDSPTTSEIQDVRIGLSIEDGFGGLRRIDLDSDNRITRCVFIHQRSAPDDCGQPTQDKCYPRQIRWWRLVR